MPDHGRARWWSTGLLAHVVAFWVAGTVALVLAVLVAVLGQSLDLVRPALLAIAIPLQALAPGSVWFRRRRLRREPVTVAWRSSPVQRTRHRRTGRACANGIGTDTPRAARATVLRRPDPRSGSGLGSVRLRRRRAGPVGGRVEWTRPSGRSVSSGSALGPPRGPRRGRRGRAGAPGRCAGTRSRTGRPRGAQTLPMPMPGSRRASSVIGGRPQQVHGLQQRVVLVGGHEVRGALLRDDLDGGLVVVDLLDEREEALTGIAGGDGHGSSSTNCAGTCTGCDWRPGSVLSSGRLERDPTSRRQHAAARRPERSTR